MRTKSNFVSSSLANLVYSSISKIRNELVGQRSFSYEKPVQDSLEKLWAYFFSIFVIGFNSVPHVFVKLLNCTMMCKQGKLEIICRSDTQNNSAVEVTRILHASHCHYIKQQ